MDLIALTIGAVFGVACGVALARWRLRGFKNLGAALRSVIQRTGGQGEER